jgi:hypothetical protein
MRYYFIEEFGMYKYQLEKSHNPVDKDLLKLFDTFSWRTAEEFLELYTKRALKF